MTENTNWVVITGPPSSGKTSVINMLAEDGKTTLFEAATHVINTRMVEGETMRSILEDSERLQWESFDTQLRNCQELNLNKTAYLDRSLIDIYAYLLILGGDSVDMKKAAARYHYSHIFYFDALPYEWSGHRIEADSDDKESEVKRIEAMLLRVYKEFGYSPIRVPVMDIKQRISYIQHKIGEE